MSEMLDLVIVGAGFSGLYMLHRARRQGLRARILEAGEGVGGTWFWNRYPGARVDVESHEYSYSFSPELEADWRWKERYAAQPELEAYLNHVADRFDLRGDIELCARVVSAVFEEASSSWRIATQAGRVLRARYCVMATGCLSVPKAIDIPGADQFGGAIYTTTDWPREGVDLRGLRVGVIGTGSSAIQTITHIAPEAGALYVFQRTPSFSVPAHNGPADPEVRTRWLAGREANRRAEREHPIGILAAVSTGKLALETPPEEREQIYQERWAKGGFAIGGAFADLLISREANDTFASFIASRIRAIVKDPETAERLIPRTYPAGSKRICVDTGYFEVYNQPHVHLVDIAGAPAVITPEGVETGGRSYQLDCIILSLGFDAMTGALSRIDIRGRGGTSLEESWREGPRSYLGLMVSGFPNLFLITGPGSPSVLSNMVVSIEQHVEWISDCIAEMDRQHRTTIEPSPEAEAGWVGHVNEVAGMTLYPQAQSWYLGANVAGKARVFMPYPGGVGVYRQLCENIAANGYEGFVMSAGG